VLQQQLEAMYKDQRQHFEVPLVCVCVCVCVCAEGLMKFTPMLGGRSLGLPLQVRTLSFLVVHVRAHVKRW